MLEVRNGSNRGDVSVCVIVPPPSDFNADSLRFLIDWNNITITESILTSHLPMDEISNLVEKKLECPRFPSHLRLLSGSFEKSLKRVVVSLYTDVEMA